MSKFKLELFRGCELYAKLRIIKKKGYLKYYDTATKKEITTLEGYNIKVINHYLKQAELICYMKYSVLWSY